MKDTFFKLFYLTFLLLASGCSTLNQKIGLFPDQSADEFFNQLQRSHRQEAYQLLSWQMSQSIPFSQFDDLLQTMQNQWGNIEEFQSVLMPFHQRLSEGEFVSSSIPADQIKRYVYEIKFQHALMYCDLTLALQAGEYKIYWFSFWGSNVYMKPEIQEKMEELFSKQKQEN